MGAIPHEIAMSYYNFKKHKNEMHATATLHAEAMASLHRLFGF